MNKILKFKKQRYLVSFPDGIDIILRRLGIPQSVREDATSWVAQADLQYHIPDIELSVVLPEGLTNEQAEHIRREIYREFARYSEAIREAKYNYLVEQVKRKLAESQRTA